MSQELSLFANLVFSKDDASLTDGPHRIKVAVRGQNFTKNTAVVTSSGGTLPLGDVSNSPPGYTLFRCLRAVDFPDGNPSGVIASNIGTTGSTSYSYKVVAVALGDLRSAASGASTTSTGNATLDTSHYNKITWDAVDGTDHYEIYRTASSGTPSSTGVIGTSRTTYFRDTGLAGDSSSAPSSASPSIDGNAADTILTIGDGSVYPLAFKPGEFAIIRPQFTLNAITDTFPVVLEYTLFED